MSNRTFISHPPFPGQFALISFTSVFVCLLYLSSCHSEGIALTQACYPLDGGLDHYGLSLFSIFCGLDVKCISRNHVFEDLGPSWCCCLGRWWDFRR